MSQGAIGARLLDLCLDEQASGVGRGRLQGLSRRFHRRYGRFIDQCWLTSTAEDFGALGGRGQRAWYAPLLAAYLHRYTRLTWHDEAAARAFLDVMNLQRPPTALLSPRLLCRTLLGSRHPPPATTPTPGVAGAAP